MIAAPKAALPSMAQRACRLPMIAPGKTGTGEPMTDALQFEVKKDKWEQLQNGSYKLTVTMNPTDLTDNNDALLLDFIKCAPGSRFVLAAVRIDEDEQPVQPKEKTPFKDLPPTQQAAMLCKEVAFQKWLGLKNCTEADAKSVVYGLCRIKSLSELNSNLEAGEFWAGYCKQYIDESHLPERRS